MPNLGVTAERGQGAPGVPPRTSITGSDMATTVLDQQRVHAAHGEKTGLWSWITTVDHKRIGILYGATAFFFFLLGGIEALISASSWRSRTTTS